MGLKPGDYVRGRLGHWNWDGRIVKVEKYPTVQLEFALLTISIRHIFEVNGQPYDYSEEGWYATVEE